MPLDQSLQALGRVDNVQPKLLFVQHRTAHVDAFVANELHICSVNTAAGIYSDEEKTKDGGSAVYVGEPEGGELLFERPVILFENRGCHGLAQILRAKQVQIKIG